VALGGVTRTIAGRVCMDQFMLDVGDDPVEIGDVVVLFGGGEGEPRADDWAAACDTINYEIVARMGGVRVPRVYEGERG
jgi:alanine racemase